MPTILITKTVYRQPPTANLLLLVIFLLLALLAMGGLAHGTMNLQDNPLGMFLVSGHLYFLPSVGGIVGNVLLIMILAGVTAYFPARRAASLSPAAALRHFESDAIRLAGLVAEPGRSCPTMLRRFHA